MFFEALHGVIDLFHANGTKAQQLLKDITSTWK